MTIKSRSCMLHLFESPSAVLAAHSARPLLLPQAKQQPPELPSYPMHQHDNLSFAINATRLWPIFCIRNKSKLKKFFNCFVKLTFLIDDALMIISLSPHILSSLISKFHYNIDWNQNQDQNCNLKWVRGWGWWFDWGKNLEKKCFWGHWWHIFSPPWA